jgi:AcrR family transcriptional regulator
MSIDAIAKAAGVGKPTIYRRWKDKADIATTALAEPVDRVLVEQLHPRLDSVPTRAQREAYEARTGRCA